jgi:hypothetical protein
MNGIAQNQTPSQSELDTITTDGGQSGNSALDNAANELSRALNGGGQDAYDHAMGDTGSTP